MVGVTAGFVICLQAMTGLPWSGVFGDLLRKSIDAAGQGIPPMVCDDRPKSTVPPKRDHQAVPGAHNSDALTSNAQHDDLDIGLDTVVAKADALGMRPGYAISIPIAPDGVYTAMAFEPDDSRARRVVHVDRYTGEVLDDIIFADYGAASRIIEFGNAMHKGNLFGAGNQLLMLGACAGAWTLAATGLVMWWKRRPVAGGLAPPPLLSSRDARIVFLITALVSLLFPMTAASLLPLMIVDRFVLTGWGRLHVGEATSDAKTSAQLD